jgi:hypothetical protein
MIYSDWIPRYDGFVIASRHDVMLPLHDNTWARHAVLTEMQNVDQNKIAFTGWFIVWLLLHGCYYWLCSLWWLNSAPVLTQGCGKPCETGTNIRLTKGGTADLCAAKRRIIGNAEAWQPYHGIRHAAISLLLAITNKQPLRAWLNQFTALQTLTDILHWATNWRVATAAASLGASNLLTAKQHGGL